MKHTAHNLPNGNKIHESVLNGKPLNQLSVLETLVYMGLRQTAASREHLAAALNEAYEAGRKAGQMDCDPPYGPWAGMNFGSTVDQSEGD